VKAYANKYDIYINVLNFPSHRRGSSYRYILRSIALSTITDLSERTVRLWHYTKARNDLAAGLSVYFTNKNEKFASLQCNTHECCLEIKHRLLHHTNSCGDDKQQRAVR
jgi:hypothetical protein